MTALEMLRIRHSEGIHTVNCPVSLSKPTCVTWTGFPGAEIFTARGEPRTLLTKLENPLFFRHGPEVLASSEYRLDAVRPVSERGGVMSTDRSTVEKLADCRN